MQVFVPPQYLARIAAGDDPSAALQDFLEEFGDDNYVNSFEALCESAGTPSQDSRPEYKVGGHERQGREIAFDCDVFFDEVTYGGGCADMARFEERSGSVTYRLNLATGELTADKELYK